MNTRRLLLIALAAGACAPFTSFSQVVKVHRVGFLSYRHVDFVESDSYYGPFMRGMRDLGYVEGKNVVVEWRSAEGDPERLRPLADELVRSKVDVLVAVGPTASRIAQKATSVIPVVMINMGDPIGDGIVKSLTRPGGNSTGVSNMSAETGPKKLEFLHAVVPRLTRLAVLVNPRNPTNAAAVKNIQAAGRKLGVTVYPVEASNGAEIATAFDVIARQNVGALIVSSDALFVQEFKQILALTARQRLPSLGGSTDYVAGGGLMSFGPNNRDNYRRAAYYVDKILKGANPGDIPIEQPTGFELGINLRTAKALNLNVPDSVLLQANKVIR